MVVRNTPPLLRPHSFVRKSRAAFHGFNGVVANKTRGAAKLFRELIVEVGAIGDQHNGRAGKIDTLHQQAR